MFNHFSKILRKGLFLPLVLLLLGCSQEAVHTPKWAKNTTIYEVYLRAFSKEGTLEKLRERLPVLREFGIGTIWLMPIHPIGEKGRKGSLGCPYSIRDYYAINPEYGTKEDFRRLVEEAHRLGMKVILDFVANHTSNDYVEMKDHPDWFMRDKEGKFTREVADWWDVTDLNYDNANLREYMKGVAKYWVKEFKVDGYRCDVAGMVPLKFWVELRQELKSINPSVFLLAEWESPKLHLRAFDATYDWSLYHLLVNVRKGKVRAEKAIDLVLEKERKYPANSLRLRFIENHDEKRATEVFGQEGFRPFALPKPYTLARDVFCLREKRMVNGYRRISLFNHEIEVPGVPLREEVEVHLVPDPGKGALANLKKRDSIGIIRLKLYLECLQFLGLSR